jgi:hypothetical protein
MLRLLAAALMIGLLAATPAGATITVYHDFPSYNTAVGGIHTTVVNSDTDADGAPVVPSEDANSDGRFDIEGNTFSNDVRYASPDLGSTRVNIADIGTPIFNEIGPYGIWDGIVRWEYTADYFATAFTGISVEPDAQVRLYQNGQFVESALAAGTGDVFQFFGFVSSNAFDAVELAGVFYAIDDHRSTADLATPTAQDTWGAVKARFAGR